MQDPRMTFPEEITNHKPQRPTQKATAKSKKKDNKSVQNGHALVLPKPVSKRVSSAAASPLGPQPERSNSDSLPDSSSASGGNEYRALRRKYLLLEEESFLLGGSLKEAEDEVKGLEDEKLALLDKLVVLEGLIGASELQSIAQQGKL